MRVIGKMTCSMDKELRHGLMDQCMKVFIKKEKNMGEELIPGVTGQNTLVIGLITK